MTLIRPFRVIVFCALLVFRPAPVWCQSNGETSQPLTTHIYADVAQKVVPSVVNISTTMSVKSLFPRGLPEDFFRRFFGDLGNPGYGFGFRGDMRGPRVQATALGSGFIIDSSGIILTNNHVVANATEIRIQFSEEAGEKSVPAKVVGRDPDIDIALLKVTESRKFVPLKLGNSDALRVGDLVMAVGNPFGQGHSATHGIISAKGRANPDLPLSNFLQTDAPINPGNSGGPLVNLRGEVIGINTAIQANAQGIGFAVPSNLVSQVLPQLRATGTVQRGYLGLSVEPLQPDVAAQIRLSNDLQAPIVVHVAPDSPADKAGIKEYDVITEADSAVVHTPGDLTSKISGFKPGDKVTIKIMRDGKPRDVKVTLGKRPAVHQQLGENEETPSRPSGEQKLGMAVQNLDASLARELGVKPSSGIVVTEVQAGSPAAEAGLTAGDVIVEVNRRPVKDVREFLSLIKSGQQGLLRVRHPQMGPDAYSIAVLDLRKK